jgi:hypothetical protein
MNILRSDRSTHIFTFLIHYFFNNKTRRYFVNTLYIVLTEKHTHAEEMIILLYR